MSTRRYFLQNISLTAMAVPLAPFIRSIGCNTNQQERTLRVAIMGLGNYATRVAEAMRSCKRAKITGLISGTPSKIKSWQERYGVPDRNCYNYENFDQIKNNQDIDAVYV